MAIYSIVYTLVGGASVGLVGVMSDTLALGPRTLLYAIVIARVPSMVLGGLLLRLAERSLGKMVDEIRAAEAS
ncbi:MAG: hypothetical protein JNM59_14700 [Hyphomonadaceae bacterium]|nr:hypothetical protein [Hyphomonadaceae bacterium]